MHAYLVKVKGVACKVRVELAQCKSKSACALGVMVSWLIWPLGPDKMEGKLISV